jgi:hypothetical protein
MLGTQKNPDLETGALVSLVVRDLLQGFDLPGPPSLVEPWLQRATEAKDHKPAFAGKGLHPVVSKPAGALGPK